MMFIVRNFFLTALGMCAIIPMSDASMDVKHKAEIGISCTAAAAKGKAHDALDKVRELLLNKDNKNLQELLNRRLRPDTKIDGHPLLVWAANTKNLDFYEDLLKAGANINVNDAQGTPLSMSSLQCDDPIYLLKLLVKGLNPNAIAKGSDGKERPLLWWALYAGRSKHFELLRKHGAGFKALFEVDNKGDECAWKLAVKEFETKPLELLLEGKNPNDIHVAHEGQSYSLLAYAKEFGTPEALKVLKKAGATESMCIIS